MLKALALCLILTVVQCLPYRLVIHGTDPEAKCLDGSSPGFYVHEGGDKDKILIYFLGGGYCATPRLVDSYESCYQRSMSGLGSSKNYPPYIESIEAILSTDPTKSKFASWTKVVVGYCDGMLHQGYTQAPLKYKGVDIYFRGSANTRSHFQYLLTNHNLGKASRVVLSGASAGGAAAIMWANYLRTLTMTPSVVLTVPDSSGMVDAVSFKTGEHLFRSSILNMITLANVVEPQPNQQCNMRYPNEQWKCFIWYYAHPTIMGDVLLINSQYDAWAIENLLQIGCPQPNPISGLTLKKCNQDEMKAIITMRGEFKKSVDEFINVQSVRHSVWTIGCSYHVYTFQDKMYSNANEAISSLTVKQALEQFVFEGKNVQAIDQTWPSNAPCA